MLSYCLNVHPGTSLTAVKDAVLVKAPEVYRRLRENTGFSDACGVGIWLSEVAAKEVEGQAEAFAADVERVGLKCDTFNGFPFGSFHDVRVKDSVYLPDWSSRKRVEHTLRLARILTHFLKDGQAGSISTVPIGYRAHFDDAKLRLAQKNLMIVAAELDALNSRSSRIVRLALEPEPDCLLDNVEATITFFERHVPMEVRHVIGVCLDSTHVAVESETPLLTMERLVAAKIPIYKIQLGAALIGDATSNFEPFADEVYLHQTKIENNGVVGDYPDLPAALASGDVGVWKVHYHVPLIWTGNDSLHSSRDLLTPKFFVRAQELGVSTFEVETYTLGVFPDKRMSDVDILAGELAWVCERLRIFT